MISLRDNVFPLPSDESSSTDDEDDHGPPHQCMSREAMMKLFEMRLNNQLCDAAIRIEGDKIYNIHRAILCACSSYFR